MSPLSLLLFQAAVPAITYQELGTLPPAVLGERVLAARPHRPIVEVRPQPIGGLMLSDIEYLWLFERPERVEGGCVRRQWWADFRYRGARRASAADLVAARADEQVALASANGCTGAAFASYRGVERPRAFTLLAGWRAWLRSSDHGSVRCATDNPASSLCRDDRRTTAALLSSAIWHLPADLSFWLRRGDGRVITVRFDALPPRTVTIDEAVPPPA